MRLLLAALALTFVFAPPNDAAAWRLNLDVWRWREGLDPGLGRLAVDDSNWREGRLGELLVPDADHGRWLRIHAHIPVAGEYTLALPASTGALEVLVDGRQVGGAQRDSMWRVVQPPRRLRLGALGPGGVVVAVRAAMDGEQAPWVRGPIELGDAEAFAADEPDPGTSIPGLTLLAAALLLGASSLRPRFRAGRVELRWAAGASAAAGVAALAAWAPVSVSGVIVVWAMVPAMVSLGAGCVAGLARAPANAVRVALACGVVAVALVLLGGTVASGWLGAAGALAAGLGLARHARAALQAPPDADLADLVHAAAASYCHVSSARRVGLTFQGWDGLRAEVDPETVEAIVRTLVGDAMLRAAPGGTVRVKVEPCDGGAALQVADAAPQDGPRAGLVLVERLAARMEGRVDANPERVRVWLPHEDQREG